MIRNFLKMPWPLRILTAGGIAILFFVVGSMRPNSSINVFGQPVTTAQWWDSGAGLFSLTVGLLICIATVMMLGRSRYGRLVYILTWIVISLSVPFTAGALGGASSHILSISISNVVLTLLIAFYLYMNAAVKIYFSKNIGEGYN